MVRATIPAHHRLFHSAGAETTKAEEIVLNFEWTDEKIQIVRDLWGHQSSEQIACIVGHPSRSAVCGKAHRLGLSGLRKGPGSMMRVFGGKPRPRVHKRQRFREVPPMKPLFEELRDNPPKVDGAKLFADFLCEPIDLPWSTCCTLMDLTNSTCRWPLWDDVVSDQYCGALPLKGSAYCCAHSAIAYTGRRG